MNPSILRFGILWLAIGSAQFVKADEPSKEIALPKGKSCQGTLQIGDKTYKLEHIVAYEVKVFDNFGIAILVSDRAIPVDKLKTALREGKGTDDRFNLFQPQVKINFSDSGEVMFCNAYADNNSASVSGGGLLGQLTVKDGRVRGKASLPNDPDSNRKRNFDVIFDVALIPSPVPKSNAATAKNEKTATTDDEDDDDKPKPAAKGEQVNVHDLPLPKDAADVVYKTLVEQMTYKSGSDVKTLSTFLGQELGKQGWKSDGSDLITPKSAILKREKGEASLTIFVKPAATGSTVMIMAEGLSWEETK